jgi:Fe-Mn family superoxide dismutase
MIEFSKKITSIIILPSLFILTQSCGIEKQHNLNKNQLLSINMTTLQSENQKAPFTLPSLPFAETAFEPLLSKESFEYHYKKHHNAYVVKLNELVDGTEYQTLTLKEIIVKSEIDGKQAIFNNAAQVWNHDFLWHSMAQNGGIKNITPKAKEMIEKSFGSVETFKAKLHENGIGQFGSGWVWVVLNKETGNLEITKTANAQTPLTNPKLKPVITIDVWEHAYYIDYRNKRPDYLTTFIESLINWGFFERNMQKNAQ